jgi:hypothetical protein
LANLAMLRAAFPEFNGVSDVLVTTKLAEAQIEIDNSVWGAYGAVGAPMTKADTGQMWLAAHKLAMTPFGQNARMVTNARGRGYEKTTYGSEFVNLRTSVVAGFRVA